MIYREPAARYKSVARKPSSVSASREDTSARRARRANRPGRAMREPWRLLAASRELRSKQLLGDEKVTDGNGHQGHHDVRDEDAYSGEIVAQTTILAESAVLHLQHLLSGWQDGLPGKGGLRQGDSVSYRLLTYRQVRLQSLAIYPRDLPRRRTGFASGGARQYHLSWSRLSCP